MTVGRATPSKRLRRWATWAAQIRKPASSGAGRLTRRAAANDTAAYPESGPATRDTSVYAISY